MINLPIKNALENYIHENNIPFSMPGHKQGRGFCIEEQKMNLKDLFLKADLTEVDGLDNLHNPEEAIKEAEGLLSNLYKSKKSYFLVNGSTSGNLAMIFSCFDEGDKVLVERNCHRSIFNGIILRKLTPIYVKNLIDEELNAPISLDKEDFYGLLKEHSDIKGVILTYPNYYGVAVDLREIIQECKQRNIKVLVDAAHGAHFGRHEQLPKNPVELGAHITVMSAHKTLPSLTQTAFLHVNEGVDVSRVDFYVSTFLSTSPSYMFLLSMDYARAYLQYRGKEDYDKLIKLCSYFMEEVSSLDLFRIWNKEQINKRYKDLVIDPTRIVINLKYGLSGNKLLQYLRESKIQAEMSDESNVVLIPSTFNEKNDFDKLAYALKQCKEEYLRQNLRKISPYHIPEQKLKPFEVMSLNKKMVGLEEALGEVSGDNIIPYPPGIPLVMMGEVIDYKSLELIKGFINSGTTVLGIKNNELLVIDM